MTNNHDSFHPMDLVYYFSLLPNDLPLLLIHGVVVVNEVCDKIGEEGGGDGGGKEGKERGEALSRN